MVAGFHKEEAEAVSPPKGQEQTYHKNTSAKAHYKTRQDLKRKEIVSMSWYKDCHIHIEGQRNWEQLSCIWYKIQAVQQSTQCEVSFFWHPCPWDTKCHHCYASWVSFQRYSIILHINEHMFYVYDFINVYLLHQWCVLCSFILMSSAHTSLFHLIRHAKVVLFFAVTTQIYLVNI